MFLVAGSSAWIATPVMMIGDAATLCRLIPKIRKSKSGTILLGHCRPPVQWMLVPAADPGSSAARLTSRSNVPLTAHS